MKPKPGNRFRVCGTPSKTGCITCKIRRVKCGEEHPFCKRCTSTGRKCDGYAPPKSPGPLSGKTTPRSLSRGPSRTPETDPLEQQLLYFFRTVTAPKLSGQFSSDFWEKRVFQASTVEPSVRYAVLAIAGIHQDNVNWHQSKFVDPLLQAFAFRQYTTAISHMHQLMSTQTQQLDLTLVACICFITFDCLLGNHESAIIHLKAGLKILEDLRLRRSPGSNRIHEWEREFGPILLSLGTQAASFVHPDHDLDRSELWVSLQNAGCFNPTNTFYSLDEARHALDTIAANITVERNTALRRPHDLHHYDTSDRRVSDSLRQMDSIFAWTEGLDKFLVDSTTNDAIAMNRMNLGASLLKVHSLIYQIVIQTPFASEGKFEDVLAHCEYLVTARSNSMYEIGDLNFTPDIGLIAPLFFTILRAPNSSVQRRAAELLACAHGREGMWDTADALRIARDALDAAGYEECVFGSPLLATSAEPIPGRMRHPITDRMVWPFGERWEIPISSTHTTPQLEHTLLHSPSAQTTPHSAQEATFSQMQMPPQLKVDVDPAFASPEHTIPQMVNDPTFSGHCLLQPSYELSFF